MAKPTFSLPVVQNTQTTKQLLDDEVNRYGGLIWDDSAGHIADQSNPHNVTAAQIGEDAIKAVYESNADTNAFTDADKTALTAFNAFGDVYVNISTGLAAVPEGYYFTAEDGDEIVRYRHDAGSVATEIARWPNSVIYTALSHPFNRNLYGVAEQTNVEGMTASEVTLDISEGTVTIAGGVGNDYRIATGSAGRIFPAGRLVVWFRHISGDLGATFIAGGSFNRRGDFYVAEFPNYGGGSPNINIDNAGADPLVITDLSFAYGPPSASADFEQDSTRRLRDFFETTGGENEPGDGNLWPENLMPFTVTAGTLGDVRASGLAVAPGQKQVAIAYVTDTSDNPAIINRMWLDYASSGGVGGNQFFQRIAGKPGYYIAFPDMDAIGLASSTIYVELRCDNNQKIAAYTQTDVVVQWCHLYNDSLPEFAASTGGTVASGYDASELVVSHTATDTTVHVPASEMPGDKYTRYFHSDFTAAAGSGTHLQDLYAVTRTGDEAFVVDARLTAIGGQTTAAFHETSADAFSFGEGHGYCAPNGTSMIFVDGQPKPIGTAATYKCAEFTRVDFHEVYAYGTTNVMLNLTIAYRYVASERALYMDVTAVAAGTFTVGPWYMSQWNLEDAYFDRGIYPGRSYEVKSGGGLTADYNGTTELIMYDTAEPYSINLEIVKGDVVSHWIEFSGNSTKPYFSATPAAYTFHSAPEPSPTTVNEGDTYRMVTKLIALRAA